MKRFLSQLMLCFGFLLPCISKLSLDNYTSNIGQAFHLSNKSIAILIPFNPCVSTALNTKPEEIKNLNACIYSQDLSLYLLCVKLGMVEIIESNFADINMKYIKFNFVCIQKHRNISTEVSHLFQIDDLNINNKSISRAMWVELISQEGAMLLQDSFLHLELWLHGSDTSRDPSKEIYLEIELNNELSTIPLNMLTYKIIHGVVMVSLQISFDEDSLGLQVISIASHQKHLVHNTHSPSHEHIVGIKKILLYEVLPTNQTFETAQTYFSPVHPPSSPTHDTTNFSQRDTHSTWSSGIKSELFDVVSAQDSPNMRSEEALGTEFWKPVHQLHVWHVAGGAFDGQFKVFADQWRPLSLTHNIRFTLLWICSDLPCEDMDVATRQVVENHRDVVTVVKLPVMRVPTERLGERPRDGSQSFLMWQQALSTPSSFDSFAENIATATATNIDVPRVYEYIVHRLRLANHVVDEVQPDWVRKVWTDWVVATRSEATPDIIVIGNTATASDLVAPEVGKLLGAKALVLEVGTSVAPPHSLLQYDTVVGPSHYAVSAFYTNTHTSKTDQEFIRQQTQQIEIAAVAKTTKAASTKRMIRNFFINSPGVNVTAQDEFLEMNGYQRCIFSCPENDISNDTGSGCSPSDIDVGASGHCRKDSAYRGIKDVCKGVLGGVTGDASLQDLDRRYQPVMAKRCCNSTIVIGFVGRLVGVKGVGMFLLAASLVIKQTPNVKFVIIGTGSARPHLEAIVDRLAMRNYVQFMGQMSHPKIGLAFASIDILVATSMNRMETFAIVNIEAMVAAVPIVSFGTFGQGENLISPAFPLEYRNALIVHKPLPEDVAESIVHLVRNDTLRWVLGCNGRRLVEERFTTYQMAWRYANLYRTVALDRLVKKR